MTTKKTNSELTPSEKKAFQILIDHDLHQQGISDPQERKEMALDINCMLLVGETQYVYIVEYLEMHGYCINIIEKSDESVQTFEPS